MRACARDTASRLCVRTVFCSSAFSLAPPLCSLASSLLRAGPTSPSLSSSATASGLPDHVPATTGGDGDGDLPVPVQKASAHARVYDDAGPACVLRYRRAPCCLLWDGKHRHPELWGRHMVWARILAYISGTVDQELLLRNETLGIYTAPASSAQRSAFPW